LREKLHDKKKVHDKKKGPPESQRPKSREETPKEGYEARAISLRCTLYIAAPHKCQGAFCRVGAERLRRGVAVYKQTLKTYSYV